MFSTVKKIHFVGVGGIGMSAIAEILLSQNFQVSGSDLNRSDNTDYLASLGAVIFFGHDEKHVADAEVVVYSSAVDPKKNPETLFAERRGIPTLRRAEMLAEVSRLNYCLAVAGTHGKTTTTSLCGLIMIKAGFDPTVIVGGRLSGLGGSNARLGKGDWTVVEADEYDRSFLQLLPSVAVVNNVEAEHMDIYKDFDDLKNAFVEFTNKTPFYGFAAVGIDDRGVKEILFDIKKKVITFGLSPQADICATNIEYEDGAAKFKVKSRGKDLGEMKLKIPGEHNVKNALAATAVCLELGADFETIAEAVGEFAGVYRRFEIKGERNGVLVVDDYAHHPTEIRATLDAAAASRNRRIVCVFQPHTYTRTKAFYKEFGASFDKADELVVTDVYPAREKPIEGIDGKLIADAAIKYGHRNVNYVESESLLYSEVQKILKEGDMVVTVGAGDIWKLSDRLAGTTKK